MRKNYCSLPPHLTLPPSMSKDNLFYITLENPMQWRSCVIKLFSLSLASAKFPLQCFLSMTKIFSSHSSDAACNFMWLEWDPHPVSKIGATLSACLAICISGDVWFYSSCLCSLPELWLWSLMLADLAPHVLAVVLTSSLIFSTSIFCHVKWSLESK